MDCVSAEVVEITVGTSTVVGDGSALAVVIRPNDVVCVCVSVVGCLSVGRKGVRMV